MKYINFGILSLFLLFNYSYTNAQDSTWIQTFTWDSLGRSGYFDFPDDNKEYEKILMIYNMRCFDAAVGNGNVGCKEWDYSCNTFVHVPEMKDSTIAFKYDHEVSQISDDYFAFSPEPHYTHYAIDKITTEYKNTSSEQTYTILGSSPESLILNTENPRRLQFIFTLEELQNAGFSPGNITGIGLDFISDMNTLNDCEINMSHIDDDNLSDVGPLMDSLQNVFFSDVYFPNKGINRFNFHSDFTWDGLSSLLIDLSFAKNNAQEIEINGHEMFNTCMLTKEDHQQESCLEFGGSWGIEIPAAAFENIEHELSIAFWSFGRPQDLPSRQNSVLEAFDENNKRTVNIHLPWTNKGIYWDCGNAGNAYDRINKVAEKEEFSKQWNHWAFTKNVQTGDMKIYLNGRLWHEGTEKHRPINIKKFRLGSSVAHSLGYYGMLDECSFWNVELDEEEIRQIMVNSIDSQHPHFQNLLAYYDIESGSGNVLFDKSMHGHHAHFEGGPVWRKNEKGRFLHQNFEVQNARPNFYFYRGSYQIKEEIEQSIEELVSPQYSVLQYAVADNKLIQLDTFFMWESRDINVYDQDGEILESYYFEPIDFIIFEELEYFTFRDAKLELLSLVTPYGNGLDLGPEGKTFTFDVSDFSPVLKGNRRLTVEFGSTQEELDIKFLFIEGKAAREVLAIKNIWPFARGYYAPIQNNRIFEPRSVEIPINSHYTKVRSSITGHGQNGEFQLRDHRISLNTNQKHFDFTVWKECADNPIYPQGGTWIYDRAGWCPGMATDLHEFDLTPYTNPGESVKLDYNVKGSHMDQANYLVSNQLVFYGPANFNLDASIDRIIRPNTEAVEFARYNPLCSDPAIIIQNRGSDKLTSLRIIYGIEGVSEKTYNWSGSLDFLEKTEVILPVDGLAFWGTEEENEFKVRIELPNGQNDQYSNNNHLSSKYERTDVYEGSERWLLRVNTNNQAHENAYTLVDQLGNIILERDDLENNTTYDDEITLPAGCYSFEITDSGNDGLSFWNHPNAGYGYVSIRRMANDDVSFEKIKFEEDFGAIFNYDFSIDESVSNKDITAFTRVGLFPNPANEWIHIDAQGLAGELAKYKIISVEGKLVKEGQLNLREGGIMIKLPISKLENGYYQLKIMDEKNTWTKAFIKM